MSSAEETTGTNCIFLVSYVTRKLCSDLFSRQPQSTSLTLAKLNVGFIIVAEFSRALRARKRKRLSVRMANEISQ